MAAARGADDGSKAPVRVAPRWTSTRASLYTVFSNICSAARSPIKLYPSPAQGQGLLALLGAHKDLWNAALEERIDAWRKGAVSISYEDQCASLTQVRGELPEEWASMNCSAQQVTLRRLDKAFKAFFERCRRGQAPGFPRFKSVARMPSIGFKGHGDGWRFAPNLANAGRPDDFGVIGWAKHGTVRLQGVRHIKCRGQARAGGTVKSCELLHRSGTWHVSLTLECADVDLKRERVEHHAMAADWGVARLLTIVRTNGAPDEVREDVENPRWYREAKERLTEVDRAVSRKKRGSRSWRKAGARRAAVRAKVARQRHDHQHKLSAGIAARCAIFATEKLTIRNMTASAAGTVKEPGKNVAQKAGLNREILDTTPAALLQKIAYKVLDTGGNTWKRQRSGSSPRRCARSAAPRRKRSWKNVGTAATCAGTSKTGTQPQHAWCCTGRSGCRKINAGRNGPRLKHQKPPPT
jgi:putative transposase